MHDQAPSAGQPTNLETEAALLDELQPVPSGAFALAGLAVGLLLVAWLYIYFFVFVARGPVG